MRIVKPEHGDCRIIKKYAWTPITTAEGKEIRWFETCYILQRFYEDYEAFDDMLCDYWQNVQFVTAEDYKKYKEYYGNGYFKQT